MLHLCQLFIIPAFATSLTGLFVAANATDGANWGIIITAIGTLITAVIGGVVLVMTTRSKTKIEEMKVAADLERIKRDHEYKVNEVRADAQRVVSLVNAGALSRLQNSMVDNTAETVKSSATADQTKMIVEELTKKVDAIPVNKSEVDPLQVEVVNQQDNPVPTTSTAP